MKAVATAPEKVLSARSAVADFGFEYTLGESAGLNSSATPTPTRPSQACQKSEPSGSVVGALVALKEGLLRS